MIKLLVKEVGDPVLRENMKRVQKELSQNQVILNGQWKFFEISFDAAITSYLYPHGFEFIPTDVIQTSSTGPGRFTVEWNYDEFDRTNLSITVGDACVVRAFIGRYEEGAGEQ